MGEYISRETVLKELSKNNITKRITLADGVSIYDTIHNLPTADVVEVVRCKDCKWWYKETDCRNMSGLYRFVPNGNWFCASGERRTE
jgi:hypothetical protein